MRQFNIVFGFANQITHQIFDVATNVAGFTEFGGITFDKRDTDFIGNQLYDIGFANAGGADHEHIVLNAADHGAGRFRTVQGALDAIKMGAYFCR